MSSDFLTPILFWTSSKKWLSYFNRKQFPFQAHKHSFLWDPLSKQTPVPGTAAIVKRYKMLDPKELFSPLLSQCATISLAQAPRAGCLQGLDTAFQKQRCAYISEQLPWILYNTLGKNILNTLTPPPFASVFAKISMLFTEEGIVGQNSSFCFGTPSTCTKLHE